METRELTFNELPEAVTRISDKVGRIEQMLMALQPPTSPAIPEINYTLPEAADYCRMAEPTFRVYLRRREVSGFKLGKAWLFKKSDLDAFLQSYRMKSSAEVESAANQILRRAK